MNKSFFILLLILSVSLFGCGDATPAQSTFKAGFSLDAIVTANQQYLREVARISGGAEVGPTNQFSQRHEEMMVRIDPANVPTFWEAIRADVEQALLDNNADITGSERSGGEHFSFSYSENGLHGTIHVWGVPGEETSYTLILLITEN